MPRPVLPLSLAVGLLLGARLAQAQAPSQNPEAGTAAERNECVREPKTCSTTAAQKESAFTLLGGVSGGGLLFAGEHYHPRLDLWTTLRLHFVDIGLYVQTLAVVFDGTDTEDWITDENGNGTKATGLGLGAQLGLHFWTAHDAKCAARIGVTARAGRAGFEATTDEDQSITVNGYAGELMFTAGIGNSGRAENLQRWAVLAFLGYSAVGVDSFNTPSGVYGLRETTHWFAFGVGFELGYNVPLSP